MKRKNVEEFLSARAEMPVVDVRSPSEFNSGHIPSAHSLPLFTDKERAVVGTLYKQEGKQEAIKKGLDIVGPRMRSMVEQAESLGSDRVALYCWRGGMRSESVAWLLERYGLKTTILEGGYKAFRRELGRFFNRELPLAVITGYTGSQKTRFLGMMKEKGAQVIDLEGLARHQGSIYGNQKCEGQPTTEHFHNLLYESFRWMNLSRTVWIEDESFSIGRVNLPEGLYQQKRRAPHIFIEVDKADRIEFLVEDYGVLPADSLIAATEAIGRRLGNDRASEAVGLIREGKLKAAAEIILHYYDARYHKSISEKRELIVAHYPVGQGELPELARKLAKQNVHRYDKL